MTAEVIHEESSLHREDGERRDEEKRGGGGNRSPVWDWDQSLKAASCGRTTGPMENPDVSFLCCHLPLVSESIPGRSSNLQNFPCLLQM